MKITTLMFGIFAASLAGCDSRSNSQGGVVEIRIIAEPKTGVHEVSAYDPASVRALAAGQFEHVDYANVSDIVVWLNPADHHSIAPPAPLVLDMIPAKPLTGIRVATVGQKIRFNNRYEQALDLYSVSDGNDFDFPAIAPGASGEYVTRAEGLIEILSDPTQPPAAQVYVAGSSWVRAAHSGERVTFGSLPAGTYEAWAWHPRLPGASVPVSVADNQTTQATLTIGVNALQKIPSP